MKKVTLELPHETYNTLRAVVDGCNFAEKHSSCGTSHGQLDVKKLLLMLAEDAAMTYTRPGSWEGANMQQVLDSHGYYR